MPAAIHTPPQLPGDQRWEPDLVLRLDSCEEYGQGQGRARLWAAGVFEVREEDDSSSRGLLVWTSHEPSG